MALLITYDLHDEDVRPNIVGAIEKLGVWARLSESSYAVDVAMTVEQLYGKLKPLLDDNDQLLHRHSKEAVDWSRSEGSERVA